MYFTSLVTIYAHLELSPLTVDSAVQPAILELHATFSQVEWLTLNDLKCYSVEFKQKMFY